MNKNKILIVNTGGTSFLELKNNNDALWSILPRNDIPAEHYKIIGLLYKYRLDKAEDKLLLFDTIKKYITIDGFTNILVVQDYFLLEDNLIEFKNFLNDNNIKNIINIIFVDANDPFKYNEIQTPSYIISSFSFLNYLSRQYNTSSNFFFFKRGFIYSI